jgi:hypothetical protein
MEIRGIASIDPFRPKIKPSSHGSPFLRLRISKKIDGCSSYTGSKTFDTLNARIPIYKAFARVISIMQYFNYIL